MYGAFKAYAFVCQSQWGLDYDCLIWIIGVQIHEYLLFNEPCMGVWEIKYRKERARWAREKVKPLKSFLEWVQEAVFLGTVANEPLSHEVQEIVNGPSQVAYYYKSCTINGRHYRIESVDENAPVTTYSGIATLSFIDCVARKNDPRSQQAKLQYYGVLEEILEVQLSYQRKDVMFKGKWYNTIVRSHNGVTQVEDECGFMKNQNSVKFR